MWYFKKKFPRFGQNVRPGESVPYIRFDKKYILFLRDRDQDTYSSGNCATSWTGGWWYTDCHHAHPTGQHSSVKEYGGKYITYYYGGERGNGLDSWAEAEYLLIPI